MVKVRANPTKYRGNIIVYFSVPFFRLIRHNNFYIKNLFYLSISHYIIKFPFALFNISSDEIQQYVEISRQTIEKSVTEPNFLLGANKKEIVKTQVLSADMGIDFQNICFFMVKNGFFRSISDFIRTSVQDFICFIFVSNDKKADVE